MPVLEGPAIPSSASPGYAWRNSRAARFFAAVCLSLYGDWLSTVALLVVLFELTHTAAAPAGYMLVRVAPRAAVPWLGGHVADRFSPRRVMVATAIAQGLFTASLIASHRSGTVWSIYAAVGLAQLVGALGRPSQGALLPTLVKESDLPRANATYGLFFSTSIFLAPAIGAALLVRGGADLLFALDAGTFLACALLIYSLPSGSTTAARVGASSTRDHGKSALRLALRQPAIRMIAAANFATAFTVTVTQALLVVAANERFGSDAAVGYLYSSVGVGGAVGGLIALRWIPRRGWIRLAVYAATVVDLVAIAGFAASAVAVLALLALAVSSLTGSSVDAWGLTEVQRRAPPGFMGRFNSVIVSSMYTGMLGGAVWALATAHFIHWDIAIELASTAMLLLVGVVWLLGSDQADHREQREP